MCNVAEADGYSNDICAYARVSLAYAKLKECPEQDVAMPDVLLCCNNICNCMIKWYENLARDLNIPMIILDIPFNPDYEYLTLRLNMFPLSSGTQFTSSRSYLD